VIPLLAKKEPAEAPMDGVRWVPHGGSSNKVTIARNLKLRQGEVVWVS